jgi:hypothetical protein
MNHIYIYILIKSFFFTDRIFFTTDHFYLTLYIFKNYLLFTIFTIIAPGKAD